MTVTTVCNMRRRSSRRGSRSYSQLPFVSEIDPASQLRSSPLRRKKSQRDESENPLIRKRKRVDDSPPFDNKRTSAKKLGLDDDSPTFSVKSFYGIGAGPTEKLARAEPDIAVRHVAVQRVKRPQPLRDVPPTNVLALAPNKPTAATKRRKPAAVPGNAPSPKTKENRRFFQHKACDRRRLTGKTTVSMRKGFHLRYQPVKSRSASDKIVDKPTMAPKLLADNIRQPTTALSPSVAIARVRTLAEVENRSPDLFLSSGKTSESVVNKDSGVASDETTVVDPLLDFLDNDGSVCSGDSNGGSAADSINLIPCNSSKNKGVDGEQGKSQSKQLYPLFGPRPVKPFSPGTPTSRWLAALSQGGATSSPASSKSSPKQVIRTLRGRDGKEQMTLDFGQKLIGAVRCGICGMTYTHGEPGDEATHSKFHQRLAAVLKFPGWKRERVVQEYMDGSRIIVVTPDDKFAAKKMEAIRKIVDDELGFVVDGQHTAAKSKTFLYVSADKRIVGCCIAEVAQQGYRLLEGEAVGARPWCCSSQPERVKCGVSRIWVLSSERRKGIARKLLDSIRFTFLLGCPLQLNELAFSGPTPNGKSLATSYFGSPSFLIYNHQQR